MTFSQNVSGPLLLGDLDAPWMAIGGIMVIARFASDINAAVRGAEHDAAINAGARSWR